MNISKFFSINMRKGWGVAMELLSNIKKKIQCCFKVESLSKIDKVRIVALIIATIILSLCKMYLIPQRLLMILIMGFSVMLFMNVISEVDLIIYSLIFPSELYIFVGLAISIFSFVIKVLRKKIELKMIKYDLKQDKYIQLFLSVIIISSILSIISTRVILNLLIYIMYLLLMLIIFKIAKLTKYKFSKLIKNMNYLFFIQIVVCILQGIQQLKVIGKIESGDQYTGTLANAHMFCAWLIWYMILLIINYKDKIVQFKNNIVKEKSFVKFICLLVKLLSVIVLIYLSDGKHLWLAFGFALICWIVLIFIKPIRKYSVIIVGITIILSLFISTNIVKISGFKEWISNKSSYISMYIYEEPFNTKFGYFDETLNDNLKGKDIVFGLGPGQYGSRVANLRAYEYMVKEDGLSKALSKIVPPYVSNQYKEQASKYNEEFVAMIPHMSAVLAYPFSSIISLFAEVGIVGYLAFLFFLNSTTIKNNSRANKLIVITLLFLMIFDSYMEITPVVGMFWLILGILQNPIEREEYQ